MDIDLTFLMPVFIQLCFSSFFYVYECVENWRFDKISCYFRDLNMFLDYVALIPMLLVVKSLIVKFPFALYDTLFLSG